MTITMFETNIDENMKENVNAMIDNDRVFNLLLKEAPSDTLRVHLINLINNLEIRQSDLVNLKFSTMILEEKAKRINARINLLRGDAKLN